MNGEREDGGAITKAEPASEGNEDAAEVDVIVSNSYFTLVLTSESYEIRSQEGSDRALHSYPMTDAGLALAEERFDSLSRAALAANGVWFRVLRWTTAVALAAWVIAGLVRDILLSIPNTVGVEESNALRIVIVLEGTAFRVSVGAFAGLVVIWLGRGVGRRRSTS